jgi:hypothetical protein
VQAATRIVELIKAEFAHVPVLARAFDRWHEVALIHAGADYHVRETFESALDARSSARNSSRPPTRDGRTPDMSAQWTSVLLAAVSVSLDLQLTAANSGG